MRQIEFLQLVVSFLLSLTTAAQPMSLATALMQVTNATYDFAPYNSARVHLGSDDAIHPSHIILSYGDTIELLTIDSSWANEDGCIVFTATLPNTEESSDGHRMNITLESDYQCQNQGHTWKAFVREGYGFCGTMDSTMELVGAPVWRDNHYSA